MLNMRCPSKLAQKPAQGKPPISAPGKPKK